MKTTTKRVRSLSPLCTAYLETMLWLSEDDPEVGSEATIYDLSPEAIQRCEEECLAFHAKAEAAGVADILAGEFMGRDFYLTRNGHSAGFWDRGLGAAGEVLTGIAQGFGEVSLYRGDDGKLELA